ncbi:MAG TPA: response regulator, partial [Opitutaceae bacterium]|nr:response regulator [Opitutaceae bacterium]
TTRLLIVDDNARTRALLEAAARSSALFAQVTSAKDGQDALELLQRVAQGDPAALPDVVVTDLYMPDFSGAELVGALRGDPVLAGIRRVVISEWDGPAERNACHRAGCHAFFKKPPAGESLQPIIRALAAGCDASRAAAAPPAGAGAMQPAAQSESASSG